MDNNFGYFYSLWMCFFNKVIKNSVLYKALTSLYSKVSTAYKRSAFVSFFKKDVLCEWTEKSIFAKILRLPWTICENISARFGESLTRQKENSFVIRSCKYLLHNFLAINLRYIGLLALSAGVVDVTLSMVRKTSVVGAFFVAIFGLLLSLFQVNITDYLKGSCLMKFFEKLLGTSFSYNFYYVTKCKSGPRRIYSALFFGGVCGVISAYVSPVLAAVFLVGLLYTFAVFYKTEIGIFSIAFLAPIVPTMVLAGLCILTAFSFFVRALTNKKFTFKFGLPEFLVSLMIVIYMLCAFTSYAPVKSVQIFAIYLVFMGFYFVVVNTIKTKKQFFDLISTITVSSFFVCMYGIMQYVFDWDVAQAWMDEEMFTDIKMRIYATLENPNVLGEYILLTLPLAIGLMWSKKGVLAKLFYGGVSAVLFVALILTFSRGCWIGLMLSAAIFVTFVAGKLWGLLLIALPVVPFVLPESIINRFLSIGDMKDSSTSYRVYIWLGTLLLLKDFWISGIGLGTEAFTKIYPFYSYSAIVAPHPHNLFLNVLVETGAAGIVLFVLICIVLFKRLSKTAYLAGEKSQTKTIAVSIASAVAGFLLQGMFDNCFYNYRVFMIFWLILAIGISSHVAQKDELKEAEKNA